MLERKLEFCAEVTMKLLYTPYAAPLAWHAAHTFSIGLIYTDIVTPPKKNWKQLGIFLVFVSFSLTELKKTTHRGSYFY